MKTCVRYFAVCIMVLIVAFGVCTMKVSAEGNVRTGTLGDNNKVEWSYNEDTKTLTLTGSDSGLGLYTEYQGGYLKNICPDVEKIIIQNFKPIGSAENLFAKLYNLKAVEIENFDTSQVTSMNRMFSGCWYLTNLDVSDFDTSNVTDMMGMFGGCSDLTSLELSGFNTQNVTDMSSMFASCESLTDLDVSAFDTSNVKSMGNMFNGCRGLKNIDLSGFNTTNVTDMYGMFSYCENIESIKLNGFDTRNVTTMSNMFYRCFELSSLDVSGFDTTNVTDMSRMFSGCSSLTNLDVSGFDTTNVTDMNHMFNYCLNLTSLDVSGFDTTNVTDMSRMFSGCSSLTNLDVSGFDTTNVTDMNNMFNYCLNLTSLDVSGFDTKNVKKMSDMFSCCWNLASLDVSAFDTANVTDMNHMFCECCSLTSLDLSSFDTSNVCYMESMFAYCKSLTSLDLTSFDTSKVYYMQYMFENCESLTSLNLSSFDTTNLVNFNSMFEECKSLTNLDISSFDLSGMEYISNLASWNYSLSSLHTPKVIPENLTIELGLPFKDSKGNRITSLSAEHSNTVLTRDVISIVCPEKMVVGETKQLYLKINGQVKDVSENLNYNWGPTYSSVIAYSSPGVITATRDYEEAVILYVKDKDTDLNVAECSLRVEESKELAMKEHPTDISKEEGETAVFKVVATGNDISYQWQYKPAGSNQWFDSGMTGSKTDSLNVVATTARNNYQYRCVIKDKDGNKVTSNPAKLTVVKVFEITTQPSDANVKEGTKVTFKVEAKGKNLTYQWQFKSAGSDYWTNSSMTGSNTNSITVEATAARNGYQYRCVVKDINGNKATTNAAKLTVTKSIEILSQPAGASVNEGKKVTFKVEAKGTGLTYQWQFKNATATYWSDSTMTGSKTNSITVEATSARNGYQYRCVVKDSNGSKVTTNTAKLTVVKAIEITSQPANASVNEGKKVTFKVEAKGSALTYQWQFKNATATYWSDSTMAGSKTNSITVEATSARNGYQYRCVVKDGTGNKATTNAAKLTINKGVEILSQPASATINEGEKVTFKVEAKGTGLTYQWQFKNATATFWSDSTMTGSKTNSITVEATSARNGYQYRCVVKDANSSKVTTNVAKLTVTKSIEITSHPNGATVEEGDSANFKVEAKGIGLTYQWQFKSTGTDFWSDSTMAGSKTNSITVKGTAARNGYQYRCVVKDANGNMDITNAAKLTVQ